MEIAQPITMENGWFVVGFPAGSYHMSGNLTTGDHQNAIERAILQFTNTKLKLRIIEGDTIDDWQHVKFKDQHIARLRAEKATQREKESEISQAWDNLLEQISRRYATASYRQLPQGKARYVREIMQLISATMDDLMPTGEETDDISERALARALEKVGQLADIPSPFIALELMRMRGE
jgi:cell division protein YceG involved in septum cleavage